MTKTNQLLGLFAKTVRASCCVYAVAELAFMLGITNDPAF